jgi:hypothetical protein
MMGRWVGRVATEEERSKYDFGREDFQETSTRKPRRIRLRKDEFRDKGVKIERGWNCLRIVSNGGL